MKLKELEALAQAATLGDTEDWYDAECIITYLTEHQPTGDYIAAHPPDRMLRIYALIQMTHDTLERIERAKSYNTVGELADWARIAKEKLTGDL